MSRVDFCEICGDEAVVIIKEDNLNGRAICEGCLRDVGRKRGWWRRALTEETLEKTVFEGASNMEEVESELTWAEMKLLEDNNVYSSVHNLLVAFRSLCEVVDREVERND